jgi:hypothetical protein
LATTNPDDQITTKSAGVARMASDAGVVVAMPGP